MDPQLFGESFITLFVIMDPLGLVPVFLGLTRNQTDRQRGAAAGQAVLVSLLVVTVFAVFGQAILDYLGISIAALQAAGGLLLLLIALDLLTGRTGPPDGEQDVNVALVPLGTPLLAGPGAIVATMLFAQSADTSAEVVSVVLAIVAVHLVIWAALRFSGMLNRLVGRSAISLLSRIAGLLLSAIAVQLVADAVRAFVEGT